MKKKITKLWQPQNLKKEKENTIIVIAREKKDKEQPMPTTMHYPYPSIHPSHNSPHSPFSNLEDLQPPFVVIGRVIDPLH
jgi:hypothetical protein